MADLLAADLQSRAQSAERNLAFANSRREALDAAIDAAESYMKALRLTDNAAVKQKLDDKCKENLERAEKIKVDADWKRLVVDPAFTSSESFLGKPVSRRKLTTREQIILLEGSKLNGFIFPPWKEVPVEEDFELKSGEDAYEDAPRLKLSHEQQEIFAGWKRPREALSGSKAINEEEIEYQPTMGRSSTTDLVQDATSDCSIVASLCAATARAERGHLKLLSTILHPYDHEAKTPALSPSGKYILKLTFNGCERKVVIDDLLPTSNNSRTLHVIDRSNPGLLWPALVEKAYLKVRGGYDFPGSNSGTDLATLTGWIPEQIFLQDDEVAPNDLWRRIYNAFGHGDALITIGTGDLSVREERQLGLAGLHDYTIIDMAELDGSGQMLIKNPWSDGDVWKGKQKRQSSQKPTLTLLSQEQMNARYPMTPGTFWMDFGSVFQHFENLYLNWNASLFTYREDIHFTWEIGQDANNPGYFGGNPQFSITKGGQGGPVWLLLSRHFKTAEYTSKSTAPNGYISLYLFPNGGQQVFSSDGAVKRGPFVDSPNTLLRTEIPRNTPHTIVVSSQSLQPTKYNFTLSAFSRTKMDLSPAETKYPHSLSKSSSWTRDTSGGNSDSPSYTKNPQFSLSIPLHSSIALLLSSPACPSVPIHSKIFFISTSPTSSPQRITTIRTRDILASTGDYRRGCAVVETTLDPGLYTVICSTFECNQLADFTLQVSSTVPEVQLRLLPPEGSGRLSTFAPPAVFPEGVDRILAPLTTTRLMRARFIARHSSTSTATPPTAPRTPMKLSLELRQGPYKSILATSATPSREFSDEISGIRIEDLDLRPEWCSGGGLWCVVEKVGGSKNSGDGQREVISIEVLGEERIVFGDWGVGNG